MIAKKLIKSWRSREFKNSNKNGFALTAALSCAVTTSALFLGGCGSSSSASLADNLSTKLQSRLESLGLTSEQANSIATSAAAEGNVSSAYLSSEVNSDANNIRARSMGRIRASSSSGDFSSDSAKSTAAIFGGMSKGAADALDNPAVGASSDALKIEIGGKIATAISAMSVDTSIPEVASLPAADQKLMIQSTTTGMIEGLSKGGLSAEQIPSAAQTVMSKGIQAVANQFKSESDLSDVATFMAAGVVKASTSFTAFTPAQKANLLQSGTQGATAGLAAIPGLSAANIQTIASAVASGATVAAGKVFDASVLPTCLQGIAAGPVAALGDFKGMSDAEKAVLVQSTSQAATGALSRFSGFNASQVASFSTYVSTGAVGALGAVVPMSSLSTFVGAVSAGSVAALSNFTSMSDAEKAEMAKYAAQGATAGLANISGLSSNANYMQGVAQSITEGAMKGLNGVVSSANASAFVKSISNGAIAGISSVGGMDDSLKGKFAQYAAQGATTGLANVSGLGKSDLANLSQYVASGMTQGLNNAGVSSSALNSVAQSITSGASSGLLGAGLSSSELSTYGVTSKLSSGLSEGVSAGGISGLNVNAAMSNYTPPSNYTAPTGYTAPPTTQSSTVYSGGATAKI